MASKKPNMLSFNPVPHSFTCRYEKCAIVFNTKAQLESHFAVVHPDVELKFPVVHAYQPSKLLGMQVTNKCKPTRTPPFSRCPRCQRKFPKELVDKVPAIMDNHDCCLPEKERKRKAEEADGAAPKPGGSKTKKPSPE